MAEVRLAIANREYIVTCKDGEESRLLALGQMVDDMASEAGGSSGGMNESRLLLFSALLLADKLHDAKNGGIQTTDGSNKDDPGLLDAVNTLEKLADRLEAAADRLEE